MGIRIGDTAPDFTANTTQGTINFYKYLSGSWGILFSHPADFTPVCTTELGMVAKLSNEFKKRNVKVIALSVDSVSSHHEWIRDIEQTQNCEVDFPIIADEKFTVSRLFTFIHPNASANFTIRSVVFIDPSKKVRALITYPASTGRNFDEILRVLDSLQLTDKHQVATPASWTAGDDVVVLPSVKSEEIKEKYNSEFIQVKPYLRFIKCPVTSASESEIKSP